MELRLLSTELERRAFASRLTAARTTRGAGFAETKRSVMGEVHLAFGQLYALYDEQGPAPDEMLAGFALHDLASFSQSFPRPDLTYLQPEHVFECSELWATAAGAAQLARRGGWMLAKIFQAEAVLVYPIFKPWNLSIGYRGFQRAGEPIEWPYARTLGGGKIWVQAMVLEGEALQRKIESECSSDFLEVIDGGRRVRFKPSLPMCQRQAYERSAPEVAVTQPSNARSVGLAA